MINPLLELIDYKITKDSSLELQRNIAWVLQNLCRSKGRSIAVSTLQIIIPALAKLIHNQDPQIKENSVWAIGEIANTKDALSEEEAERRIQLVIDSGLIPHLVGLMDHPNDKVLQFALRAVGCVVCGTNDQTQQVLDAGAIDMVERLLDHKDQAIVKVSIRRIHL